MILEGKNVVLGVTGGIACYKAIGLCSKLVQLGAYVDVIMTEAATRFVTPLPFQTLSKRPVSLDMFDLLHEMDMTHISLAKSADVIVIAPATANTIAKLAHGLADNLLTTTVLASKAPLVLAPAMDADMWANAATQANVRVLLERGATFVGPEAGRLASGRIGEGRMSETPKILAALRQTLGRRGPLQGVRVAVTAGGTQEPLDPVRHLGNRSSGRMGYALAEAARDRGAHVALISGPVALEPVYGVETVSIRTAAEMAGAVLGRLEDSDILLMSAAVADYRPQCVAEHKIKKGGAPLVLSLERKQDILAAVAARAPGAKPGVVVGFAAETQDLLESARRKLVDKRVDLLVANDVSAADSGFGVETNRVSLLTPDGQVEAPPLMSKAEVADLILDRVVALWEHKGG